MIDGKTALITGGSEGIGFACAKKLYDLNYTVCLLSRNQEKLEAAKRKISGNSQSNRIINLSCDVTSNISVLEAVKKLTDMWGHIDVLINSAGCSMHAPSAFENITDEEYLRIMRTNVDGLFWMSRNVLSIMKQQKTGYIINILSTAAHAAQAMNAPYSASKYAANALTETLIKECRKSNIRISSISPGPVATSIWSHKITPPSEEEKAQMLRPEDIADIVGFLLSTSPGVHIRDLEVTPWN